MVKGEMAIDAPYGVDILRLRLRVMSVIPPFPFAYSTRMAFQPNIQEPVGRRIGEGPWNATGLVIKHEPDQANAAAKYVTCIVSTTHTIPQPVAQEVRKGFVMGMRLESTPSGYAVVDKS
jgi:hypothetical protein